MDDLQAWIDDDASEQEVHCVIRKKHDKSVEIIDMQTGTVMRKLFVAEAITATSGIFEFFRQLLDTNTVGPVGELQHFLRHTFLQKYYASDTMYDIVFNFSVRPSKWDGIDRVEINATVGIEHRQAKHSFFFSHNKTDNTAFVSDVKFCQ